MILVHSIKYDEIQYLFQLWMVRRKGSKQGKEETRVSIVQREQYFSEIC